MVRRLRDTLPSLQRTRDEQAWFAVGLESLGLGDFEMAEVALRRVAALDDLISRILCEA
jgi:hypothetical protein